MSPRVAGLLLALMIGCADHQDVDQPAGSGPPEPDQRNPIAIEVSIHDGALSTSGEQMLFDVSVTNRSAEPVAACTEDWALHTGIVYLRVFDRSGRELKPLGGLHADFNVEEESHLVLLRPGESIRGSIDLLIRGTTYGFHPGTYQIIAGYYCPFDGVREMEGVNARVAGQPQVSAPIAVTID